MPSDARRSRARTQVVALLWRHLDGTMIPTDARQTNRGLAGRALDCRRSCGSASARCSRFTPWAGPVGHRCVGRGDADVERGGLGARDEPEREPDRVAAAREWPRARRHGGDGVVCGLCACSHTPAPCREAHGRCCSPTGRWPLLFFFVTAIAWVFPDGRLPSRRWRPFALAGAASCAVLMAVSFLSASASAATLPRLRARCRVCPARSSASSARSAALGRLAALVGGRAGHADEAAALVGDRAPADEVARVCRRADPGGRRGLPGRDRDHRGRRRRHGRCSRCWR